MALAVAGVLAAGLATAPGALAADVTGAPGGGGFVITYTGEGTEANNLTFTRTATTLTITDAGATDIDGGGSCPNPEDDNTVTCAVEAGTDVVFNAQFGDGDDTLNVSAAGLQPLRTGMLSFGAGVDRFTGTADDDGDLGGTAIDGGPGNDVLSGGPGNDDLDGGADDDTLNGDADDDTLRGADGDDTLNGGADRDNLFGEAGADILNGEGNSDFLEGGPGADTLNGGENEPAGTASPFFDPVVSGDQASYGERTAGVTVSLDGVNNDADGDKLSGIEDLSGTSGNDTLIGDGGRNALRGDDGNDTLSGGGGDDTLTPGNGDDTMNGEAGNDALGASRGNDTHNGGDGDDALASAGCGGGSLGDLNDDTYNGGAGVDNVSLCLEADPDPPIDATFKPVKVRATLDGGRNDGPEGQNDQIAADVEDVNTGAGDDTVTGNDLPNFLTTSGGNDTLDGGLGSDILFAGARDDTVNARDGFADTIDCQTGTDTANVDQLDRTEGCETVNRETRPVALDDRPPAVAFVSPAPNTRLRSSAVNLITVNAIDDRGIAEVRLIDDGVVVGVDNAAPYVFQYRARGNDVGDNTLIAIAVDTSQQTAADVRPFEVDRFALTRRATFTPRPSRDRSRPYRFVFSGRIPLPAGVTAAQACDEGTISAQTKRGTRTISNRTGSLRRNCQYSVTVSFADRRRLGSGRLKARLRFSGNDVLAPFTTAYKSIRAG